MRVQPPDAKDCALELSGRWLLIRLRGDVSTHRSCVELTDAGERALDGID